MTFLSNGKTYNLNYPDLSSFITTQLDKEKQNKSMPFNFLNASITPDITYGDKKSMRFFFI